jgi:hypothetical protein
MTSETIYRFAFLVLLLALAAMRDRDYVTRAERRADDDRGVGRGRRQR